MRKNLALGIAAGAAGALAIGSVVLGNKRVDQWETLTLDDADDGEAVTCGGVCMHFKWGPGLATRESAPATSDGTPVLLLHGILASTYDWHKNIDVLGRRYRTVALDLIGSGFSSRVTKPVYTLNQLACWVREFLDAQGIERAHLIGHSLGGAVALQLAHDCPERVGRMVLIAPAAYLTRLPAAVYQAARLPYVPRALIGLVMTSAAARVLGWRNALGDQAHFEADTLVPRMKPMQVKGTVEALTAMAASYRGPDFPQALCSIRTPALIVWGNRDRALPVRHGRRLVRELPNARLVILDGAGHVPQEEFPDMVNRLMLDFLSQETA